MGLAARAGSCRCDDRRQNAGLRVCDKRERRRACCNAGAVASAANANTKRWHRKAKDVPDAALGGRGDLSIWKRYVRDEREEQIVFRLQRWAYVTIPYGHGGAKWADEPAEASQGTRRTSGCAMDI